jgi:hypothetical protein
MLITKEDIAKLVKFSINISDADINPFILKAERTLPTITNGYDQFTRLPVIDFELYEPGVNVPPGRYREFNGAIWRSVNSTDTEPGASNEDWFEEPLYSMFYLYIKRYLVFKAYDYFLVLHGLDVTPAGLTQQIGERFTPVSDNRRREILASNRTDLIQTENELFRVLRLYNLLPKTDECTPERGGRGRFGIGVAKNKYRE